MAPDVLPRPWMLDGGLEADRAGAGQLRIARRMAIGSHGKPGEQQAGLVELLWED